MLERGNRSSTAHLIILYINMLYFFYEQIPQNDIMFGGVFF